MYRVGIVDDEPVSRQLIRGYLERFQRENGADFAIEEFADGSELTASYRPRFDIIFLDVKMENLDGFSAARMIRETDPEVVLVFVTNMAQFAIKGYEVDALSYLVKPVPYFAFSENLKRSLERISKKDQHILVNVSGELLKLDLAKLIYVESVKHNLIFHLSDATTLQTTGTLKALTDQLEPAGFYRSNSFLLVNLGHVEGFADNETRMTNGESLPVSRSRRKSFLEALTSYFGGRVS